MDAPHRRAPHGRHGAPMARRRRQAADAVPQYTRSTHRYTARHCPVTGITQWRTDVWEPRRPGQVPAMQTERQGRDSIPRAGVRCVEYPCLPARRGQATAGTNTTTVRPARHQPTSVGRLRSPGRGSSMTGRAVACIWCSPDAAHAHRHLTRARGTPAQRTAGCVPRLMNCPVPASPTHRRSSTTTRPRNNTVRGTPTTSIPS